MKRLSAELEDLEAADCWEMIAGSSFYYNGLLVRAMAGSAYSLKTYVQYLKLRASSWSTSLTKILND